MPGITPGSRLYLWSTAAASTLALFYTTQVTLSQIQHSMFFIKEECDVYTEQTYVRTIPAQVIHARKCRDLKDMPSFIGIQLTYACYNNTIYKNYISRVLPTSNRRGPVQLYPRASLMSSNLQHLEHWLMPCQAAVLWAAYVMPRHGWEWAQHIAGCVR